MKKKILTVLGCFGATALCLLFTCGGLAFRYVSSGVNPFREIKLAVAGESLEIKSVPEPDGRTRRQLLIDSIDHGTQFQGEKRNGKEADGTLWPRVPTTYYHVHGPVGLAFNKLSWFPVPDQTRQRSDARLPASLVALSASPSPLDLLAGAWSEPPVGVIMMNNGTLATYARPMQFFDFYERNPKIMALSLAKDRNERQFTYIDDAKKRGAQIRVFEGNERQKFDKEAPKRFDHRLIVDTVRGHPGVPTKELLTNEAWQGYMDSLVDDGIVCVHVSSRDFRLEEIVAATVNDLGLAHLHVHDGRSDRNAGHYTSSWVMVARKQDTLEHIRIDADVQNLRAPAKNPDDAIKIMPVRITSSNVWTDAGSNSLSSVKR